VAKYATDQMVINRNIKISAPSGLDGALILEESMKKIQVINHGGRSHQANRLLP